MITGLTITLEQRGNFKNVLSKIKTIGMGIAKNIKNQIGENDNKKNKIEGLFWGKRKLYHSLS